MVLVSWSIEVAATKLYMDLIETRVKVNRPMNKDDPSSKAFML